MRLLLSAQGEIKSKASIIIYQGGVRKRKNEGGSHGFQGNRGEKQSLLTRYKGGGYRTLPANGGDHQNTTKLWRGRHKVNFRVIQQKPSHPLPRQYI